MNASPVHVSETPRRELYNVFNRQTAGGPSPNASVSGDWIRSN